MLLTRNDIYIYLILPFFSEVSSSQVNFFKMLDEKIENVSPCKICFNNHYENVTSILFPNSIILGLHGMHFKVTTRSSYQPIHSAFPTYENNVVQGLNLKLISIRNLCQS